MNYFFGLYKEVLPSMDGYITDTLLLPAHPAVKKGEQDDDQEEEEEKERELIHFDRLEAFLTKLAEKEEEILNRRVGQVLFPPPSTRS